MNITIDMRMINHSGIGTYLCNLVPRIIDKAPQHFFYLLGNREEVKNYSLGCQSNVELIECHSSIYSLEEQYKIVNKIPKTTDVFWSPHFNIPLFYRGRLLVTVHDVFHLAMRESAGGPHKYLYAKCMFEAIKQKADTILCVSEFTKNELVKYTGINSAIIKPIHLGVAPEWFAVPRAGRPHSNPYILYVGNVKPHKNLCRLLEAFKLLVSRVSHDLIIVGKKEGFRTGDQEVLKAADEFGGRVVFTDQVSQVQLQQYYAFADALVLPSLYEGFGLPVVEAMACGCPVIASNAASLPEVGGNAALYFDPYNPRDIADKIGQVLDNPALAEDMRQIGLVKAAGFSWDVTANATLRELSRLMIG